MLDKEGDESYDSPINCAYLFTMEKLSWIATCVLRPSLNASALGMLNDMCGPEERVFVDRPKN